MRDIELIRRNVSKLAHNGANQASIDKYVSMEGIDPSKLYDDENKNIPKQNDPRIDTELKRQDIPLRMAGEALKASPLIQATESMTGGASEDLLPMAGQLIAGGAAEASGVGAPFAVAAGAAGGGYGEMARQGIRKLRGKDTSNFSKDVASETAMSAGSEIGARALTKGIKVTANTKVGRATINAFGKALGKATELGQKGQKAVWDVLNFMGDLHPDSVQYAVKRGPAVLFRPENYDDAIMGKTAKNVVNRLDQMNEGATKAFDVTLKNFYQDEYLKKYPYIKKVTPQGINKIKDEIRFYPHRVVDAGNKAMRDFGYANRLGDIRPTVLGKIGNKLGEGQMLNDVIDHIKSFKNMTPTDALTLREELNNIIYDGWKNPRTQEHIGEVTSSGKSVLKAINRELSDRLHTRIPNLKPMDTAYQQARDIARSAKPFYGDTIKAEKFMRKYHAFTKGTATMTQGEREIADAVESVVPHRQQVLDHLYAKEFEPIIKNFWKSRALVSLAGGAGIAGAGVFQHKPMLTGVGLGVMAASSPKMIAKGLKVGEKVSGGAGKVARGIGEVVKKVAPPLTKTLLVQDRREKKNAKEQ